MGKPKKSDDYAAFRDEHGRWIGFVVREPRLQVPGRDENHALREIEALHREVQQDDRHIERITGDAE